MWRKRVQLVHHVVWGHNPGAGWMADARIRIKLGQIEIEYEGAASFLEKDLLALAKQILELQKTAPASIAPPVPTVAIPTGPAVQSPGQFDHSTDTIATILKADTG